MKVCVTGGTGFIGQHLIRRLDREDVDLSVLTRQDRAAEGPAKNARYVKGDLLDYDALKRFVEKESVVVHLAYLSHQPSENLKVLELLTKVCREKKISRFIHVSTAIVAGNCTDQVVTEATECRPASEDEATKLKLESIVTEELKASCEVTILRPTCVFGPGGQNLVKLARDMASDSRFVDYAKRSLFHGRRLNLVCVDNVVEALWFVISAKEQTEKQLFIVSEDDVPENNYDYVRQYLERELAFKPARWPRLPFVSALLPAGVAMLRKSIANPKRIYSSEGLKRHGFQRAIEFEQGLRQFVDWYKLGMNTGS